MLTLIGKKKSEGFKSLQKRLDDIVVTYQMKYTSDTAYLQDGKIIVKSKEEIDQYLLDLEQELQRWYYCSM